MDLDFVKREELLCKIVKFDPAFLLTEAVIAGIRYLEQVDGLPVVDVVTLSQSRSPNFELYEFLVIPESVYDIFTGIREVGEVWATKQIFSGYWRWTIDTNIAKLEIMNYFTKQRYVEKIANIV